MFPVIYSDRFLDHQTGGSHPESPARLTAIVKALKSVEWADQILWQEPTPVIHRPAVLPLIRRLHRPDYIDLIRRMATQGGGDLDLDTPVSPDSYDVALLAVSAWLDGVDEAMQTGEPTFVLARPPGHHAVMAGGMGFCLFNNAAIAAHYALEQPGIRRVAILDWDVHHGNGTQDIVSANPRIAYCSLHQFPCYPGTGRAEDRGGSNNILNIPMAPGSTVADYQPQFEQKVLPFFQEFQPDILIVSAGYDANQADPLAGMSLQPQDYGLFTRYCLQLTHRIVFGLEGGYHLAALAESVLATIAACLK